MRKVVRSLVLAMLIFVVAVPFLAAQDKGSSIALIAKVAGIPFFDAVNSGAQEAAKELGIKVNYVNPVDPTAEAQIEVIEAQILQGVGGITVSANDPDALVPVMKKAMGKKISVTSWDSAISPAIRPVRSSTGSPATCSRSACSSTA